MEEKIAISDDQWKCKTWSLQKTSASIQFPQNFVFVLEIENERTIDTSSHECNIVLFLIFPRKKDIHKRSVIMVIAVYSPFY